MNKRKHKHILSLISTLFGIVLFLWLIISGLKVVSWLSDHPQIYLILSSFVVVGLVVGIIKWKTIIHAFSK